MKEYIKKHPVLVLVIASVLLIGLSGYLFYENNNLINQNIVLRGQYEKSQQDLTTANESIKQKDTQLNEKNTEIESLKQTRNLSTTPTESPEDTVTSTSSSIYDRINGSDDFKNKIINALNLLQSQDGEHYSLVAGQVETINEYDNYGGYQEKRNIFIGADANPAITAPIIVHEAQHVYNVYVNRIWSYGTKEQELPCYEAELLSAQRVGSPAFFITSIQNNVNYWQSQ